MKTIPKQPPIPCPECGGLMHLKDSRYGLFYGCENYPECDCKHGAHQADGKPKGSPGDKATRQARIKAHAAFDKLWKGGRAEMSRGDAYRWMRKAMDLPPDKAHIGGFNVGQCEWLIKKVDEYFKGTADTPEEPTDGDD